LSHDEGNDENEKTPAALSPCRLFFLLARKAPTGVLFRRGPSKWVQIVKWNTETDAFDPGHWFHGRIYEKRCDLSPDGEKMIYFAQKIKKRTLRDDEYTYAWTAISKIPWLTALALWPKGDCWHGGGLFFDNRTIWLNHKPEVAVPHPKHQPPKHLKILPNPEAVGEDDPVFYPRLERDGWVQRQEWQGRHDFRDGFVTGLSAVWEKKHPFEPLELVMQDSIVRYSRRLEFAVQRKRPSALYRIEGVGWADWDHRGRLVYVKDGKLFAMRCDSVENSEPKALMDFNAARPEFREAPPWARRW
jgi:hypothetical protein